MSVEVTLAAGGEGLAAAIDGEQLRCVFARAFAPGAPVDIEARLGHRTVPLRGKSLGSKKRADGRFDVSLRLISLRREDREALRAALQG